MYCALIRINLGGTEIHVRTSIDVDTRLDKSNITPTSVALYVDQQTKFIYTRWFAYIKKAIKMLIFQLSSSFSNRTKKLYVFIANSTSNF